MYHAILPLIKTLHLQFCVSELAEVESEGLLLMSSCGRAAPPGPS